MCKWLRQTVGGWRKTQTPVHRRDHQRLGEQTYDDFMENEHDRIYEENEQKAAILSIEVMLYEEDEPVIYKLLHHPDIRYEPDWTVVRK